MSHAEPTFKERFDHAVAAWRVRPKRERVFLTTLVTLFVVVIFWFGVWLPMTRDLAHQNAVLPKARAALDHATQQWQDAAGLTRLPADDGSAAATLSRFAARFSMAPQLTAVTENGQQVSATVTAVSQDTLTQWLDALAKEAAFFPTALTMTPQSEPNVLRVEVTFVRAAP